MIIENMLAYNQDWNLEINATAESIENVLNEVYKYIVGYFSGNTSTDKKIESANNLMALLGQNNSYYEDKKGSDLIEQYSSLKNSSRMAVTIESRDIESSSVIKSAIVALLLFSIFDYHKDEICFDTSKEGIATISDPSDIYEYANLGTSSGYRFLKDSKLFSIFDTINKSWREKVVRCKGEEIPLPEILEDGYYYNKKKDITYVLFPEEHDIIKFIYYALSGEYQFFSFGPDDMFSVNELPNFPSSLARKIQTTMQSIIDGGNQINRKSDIMEINLGNSNNVIYLKFAANESDAIIKYTKLYKYAFSLFEEYLSMLKRNEENTTDAIKNDKYINILFAKIIGGDIGDAVKESSTNENYYAKPIGKELLAKYISKYCNLYKETSPNSIEISSGNPIDLSKNRIENITIESEIRLSDVKKTQYKALPEYPIQFYETVAINSSDLPMKAVEGIRDQIMDLSSISGPILSKTAFFAYNDVAKVNASDSQDKYFGIDNSFSDITFPNYKFIKKYQFETNATIVELNGEEFKTYKELYKTLMKQVRKLMVDMLESTGSINDEIDHVKRELKNLGSLEGYIKSRFADGYFTEDDFFYLYDANREHRAPNNVFVDIEFRVPVKINGHWEASWIPVTAVRDYDKYDSDITTRYEEGDGNLLHAGTYFNNFEIEDKAGVKEITLTLKSVNDINLENIIYYSISIGQKLKNIVTKESDKLLYLDQMLKDCESNFRIRFGYRDRVPNIDGEERTITVSNEFDPKFVERTSIFHDKNGKNYVKPVQTYPWTYFKIIKIESNIKDGEDTYTLTGVSSGTYVLENLSLNGIQSNFSGKSSNQKDTYLGSPKNVVGKLAKWITQASCSDRHDNEDISSARIVFLGDKPGTIITDFNNNEFIKGYRYELRNGRTFNGGDIESIENYFFDSAKNLLTARSFNIINNSETLSIQQMLDNLVEWLPSRIYYIAKNEDQTVAVYLPYEDIYKIGDFFSKQPYKTEKIKYQVIESEAYIYKDYSSDEKMQKNYSFEQGNEITNDDKNKMFHKVYFIRMYYEGPGKTNIKNNNNGGYLRVYNYRSVQKQVIESIDISDNNTELGNVMSSVTLLGVGTPMVFMYNRQDGTMYEDILSQSNGDSFNQSSFDNRVAHSIGSYQSYFDGKVDEELYPYLSLNNSQYIQLEDMDTDQLPTIASYKSEYASRFFASQQNKEYVGEITIMGDPFYYFDSTVEAGKYEIFLQMNRISNRKDYSRAESKYTGIYYINGIKHTIDEDGKYTTTLSVIKRIWSFNNDKNNESDK